MIEISLNLSPDPQAKMMEMISDHGLRESVKQKLNKLDHGTVKVRPPPCVWADSGPRGRGGARAEEGSEADGGGSREEGSGEQEGERRGVVLLKRLFCVDVVDTCPCSTQWDTLKETCEVFKRKKSGFASDPAKHAVEEIVRYPPTRMWPHVTSQYPPEHVAAPILPQKGVSP